MLYDAYNANLSYLWDPTTRVLTELGKIRIVRVAGRDPDRCREMFEFRGDRMSRSTSRARPRLRRVWEARGAMADLQITGVVDGVIVGVARDHAGARPAPEITLVCVHGAGAVTTRRVALAPNLAIANDDAFRGHRLLLTGSKDAVARTPKEWTQPFTAGVWILDLETDRMRAIGTATGGWTSDTAIPHPYLAVSWGDGSRATTGWTSHATTENVVDPITEKVTSRSR